MPYAPKPRSERYEPGPLIVSDPFTAQRIERSNASRSPMSRIAFGSLLSLALTVSPLRAQLVADGATNTLANVTNTITGDVTVGTNGSFTLLVLSNNALLTNSLNGTIGLNTTAKSNEVRLISPSARWLVGGSLFAVGSNGSFNRLVVSNGATM